MAVIDPKKYQTVIASKRWRDLRSRLMKERGERCERCRKTWAPGFKTTLQLHHKTYERLGEESDRDLELVCAVCHAAADLERAKAAQERAEAALYDARLDGWASKKYGEDWYYNCSLDEREDIENEFEEWLERCDDHD